MKYSSKEDLVKAANIQLATRDHQAIKGLMEVYANQTETEQETNDTHCDNGVGFTPADAPFLSSLAQQYQVKKYLSKKQMDILKKRIPKYARQLVEGSIRKGLIVKKNGFYAFGEDL
jgi:lipid II:glycine glycyltransferase (peptidoglycan interpeptide bridge formation enzyme)